jgi:hypothetical protein
MKEKKEYRKINMSMDTYNKIENIRKDRGFRALTHTIEYLIKYHETFNNGK